ncbi:phosphatidate cytidylyltransferase [Verrucomicrobia bacterium S94]|nr:phosphatidate cytidylyltransferase [Verrucomicrobia bacterium S94]
MAHDDPAHRHHCESLPPRACGGRLVIAPVSPVVLWFLGGLYLILITASISIRIIRPKLTPASYHELYLRIRSWWIMITVFSVAILLSRRASLIFFGFVSFLALKEYFSIIPTRRADRRVLFWAYLCIPIQYFFAANGRYGMFLVFIPVYAFLFIPLRMLTIGETKDFHRALSTIHWGLMTTVFSISHIAFLLVLNRFNTAIIGAGLVLFLVALTQFNDVAQFMWGKTCGKRKIMPKVSPNKTWEGFIGGIGSTTFLGTLLGPVLTPMDWKFSMAAGLIIGIGGFIGDVTVSALKRDLGIKDTGSMLPGHGGILDRIDSLTYTAPLFFHFIFFFYCR